MTFAVTRFTVGQPVEIRRQKGIGPDKRPVYAWEPATFSHYNRRSEPCVTVTSGATETIPFHEMLRPAQ